MIFLQCLLLERIVHDNWIVVRVSERMHSTVNYEKNPFVRLFKRYKVIMVIIVLLYLTSSQIIHQLNKWTFTTNICSFESLLRKSIWLYAEIRKQY